MSPALATAPGTPAATDPHRSAQPPVIVDAHQHFWNLEREAMPWMTARARGHPADVRAGRPRAAARARGRGAARCSCRPPAPTRTPTSMFEHASRHEWIGAVIAWIDLRSPERARRGSTELAGAAQAARLPASHPRRARPALDSPGRRAREPRAAGGAPADPRAPVRLSPPSRRRAGACGTLPGHDDRDRPSRRSRRCAPRRWSRGPQSCAPRRRTPTSWPRSPASTRCSRQATGAREDLREAVEVARRRVRPRAPAVRQRLARRAPERRLRDGVARDDARDRRRRAGARRAVALGDGAAPLRPRRGHRAGRRARRDGIDRSGDRQDQGPDHVGRVHRRAPSSRTSRTSPSASASRATRCARRCARSR